MKLASVNGGRWGIVREVKFTFCALPLENLVVMVWMSRLALIAYLVGGWLLPAMHHHAHPVAATGTTACHHHDHGHRHEGDHTVAAASVARSSCSSSAADSPLTPPAIDARQPGSHDHSGTCHLCAASSIAKTSALIVPVCVVSNPPCGEVCESDTVSLVGVWIGASSPRGPPKFV